MLNFNLVKQAGPEGTDRTGIGPLPQPEEGLPAEKTKSTEEELRGE
jgi:hypothetical protein